MVPKIKNIIIFLAIATIFALVYIFFIKQSPPTTTNLVSSSTSTTVPALNTNTATLEENSSITKDFLTLLLGVKNIKLDDAIFSDEAFISLNDSSITLTPDGNEGRVNPFAPLGSDVTN